MNTTKLISFDLQGTLSDSQFSDEFWLELLPSLYANKHVISLDQAKQILEQDFRVMGKYHELFYNHRLRLDALLSNWEFSDIISKLQSKPQLDMYLLNIIKQIPKHIPLIIFSATTHDFIELELGEAKPYFQQTFSAIDDFQIAGKTPELFKRIATLMKVNVENCLHVGDCYEMDIKNALKAGWQCYHLNNKHNRNEKLLELQGFIKDFLN